MSSHHAKPKNKAIAFLFENSLFLVAGAIAALVWANLDPDVKDEDGNVVRQGGYNQFVHFDFGLSSHHGDDHKDKAHGKDDGPAKDKQHGDGQGHAKHSDTRASGKTDTSASGKTDTSASGKAHAKNDDGHAKEADLAKGDHKDDDHKKSDGSDSEDEHHAAAGGGHHGHWFNIHFIINDILMALFFAIAGKEVWESLLPGGALSNFRKAATPLLATLGGILGPVAVYLTGAFVLGEFGSLNRGWAVPCATDIAFSYLVARLIFGPGHPAIGFLLLLAIADDAAGLVILAVFYPDPQKPVDPTWLLLTAGAIATGFGFRKLRLHSFWWYLLIPGVMSWFSFFKAGIHPALGLVPIIPCLPHAHTDLGLFARKELQRDDTLNAFEHWWKNPVEIILGLFGLVNAGVALSNVGSGTWLVLSGLMIGKPVGITLFTWIAEKGFGLQMPQGMNYRHVASLGMVAAIGFTVALFVSTAAFRTPGPVQDAVKMGALMSFFAGLTAFIFARAIGVRPETSKETAK